MFNTEYEDSICLLERGSGSHVVLLCSSVVKSCRQGSCIGCIWVIPE